MSCPGAERRTVAGLPNGWRDRFFGTRRDRHMRRLGTGVEGPSRNSSNWCNAALFVATVHL